jgi:hypothetical protein|tara:strand:+ start:1690 stop:2412 length:723 start_codon:yes stop_codon:yes gene_type:complete
MKRKKDYRSKGEKFFLEYLPTEVFDSLKPKERENYQKYRTHHRYIFEGNQQINKLEKEISKLKDKIKVKKLQINGDDENSGWKQKMMIGYEGVQKLSKDYKFNISIGFRYRKSKILKNEENYESGKVGTKKDLRNQSTFKGETLKSNPLLYLRITRTKDVFKNLYVGKEEDVRLSIGRIYKEDWSKESVEDVKDEIRVIYSTYVRYHVFHSNWGDFFNKKHTLSDVEYWSTEMGDKRWDW